MGVYEISFTSLWESVFKLIHPKVHMKGHTENYVFITIAVMQSILQFASSSRANSIFNYFYRFYGINLSKKGLTFKTVSVITYFVRREIHKPFI